MQEIFIDPNKQEIEVQITSQSLHALGFEISVFDSSGNTIIEQFTGNTKVTNPFTIVLQKSPASYKNCYIRGIFTVQSPDGTDYPYSILFSILEEGVVITPTITISGTTINGKDTAIATYHLN